MVGNNDEALQGENTETPQVTDSETVKNINAEKKESSEEEKTIKPFDVLKSIWAAYGVDGTDKNKAYAQKVVSQYLLQESQKHPCSTKYNILILYDTSSLVKQDADNIYNAITRFTEKKPILLILFSGGGSAGSAYLIGKLCREYSNGEFSVSVPRYAKSAATIICCGANKIHMGSLSELGPIDPQIDELPALGLKNSVEHLAELVKKYPESSEMFAKYLHLSLNVINIGYYERVAESAWQYAERLLATHEDLLPKKAKEVAYDLVYKYKDHSFVVDKEEAEQIFGSKIIVSKSDEYDLGNTIYRSLEFIKGFFNSFDFRFYHIGSLFTEFTVQKK